MTLQSLRSEKIAILGVSREGVSTAEFLFEHQIPFTLLEKRPLSAFADKLDLFKKWQCPSVFGDEHLQNLNQFTLLFRSPGIPLFLPELVKAKKKGLKITSHTKLFLDLCPGEVIGVTGTKGKGTTCKLIEAVLTAAHKKVFVCGNIGKPPLQFMSQLDASSYAILELSSFQLEDFEHSPHIAVVLGIAPDHLAKESEASPNYHKSFQSYIDAKKHLVKFQHHNDIVIMKEDDRHSQEIGNTSKGKKYYYSANEKVSRGSYIEDGMLMYVDDKKQKYAIGDVTQIKLKGKHHWENICAATTVAGVLGCQHAEVAKGLFNFKGYEHRLEFVAKVNDVEYYDDSAATNPEPAMAAINAFSGGIIDIIGGSDKGQDYTALGKKIANSNVKVAYLIGDMAPKIKKTIDAALKKSKNQNLHVVMAGFPTMEKIIKDCTSFARPGDVVLLSPSCASFDMFKSYIDRGNQFKEQVKKLQEDK